MSRGRELFQHAQGLIQQQKNINRARMNAAREAARRKVQMAKRAQQSTLLRNMNSPNFSKTPTGRIHNGLVGMRTQAAQGSSATGSIAGMVPDAGKTILGFVGRGKQIMDAHRRISRLAKQGLK